MPLKKFIDETGGCVKIFKTLGKKIYAETQTDKNFGALE
jgi:hypothetical protein